METPSQTASAQRVIHTAQLITAMLKSNTHVSDLIFSPGRAPQIEVSGQLVELKYKGLECLSPGDTKSIAYDIMGENEHPLRKLDQDGSADLSYGLPGVGRFRVNIFRQRGSCAIVMRVIPDKIPGFDDLKLPKTLEEIVHLKNGIVLVTGPTGSGKSSTLAAIIDKMNMEKAFHILTIEDPIEFLHRHKKATIHQRELHSDTPTFALALRGALRQAPKVILVGAMRDGDTDGMQHFDGELDKLLRAGTIDFDTALAYSTNPGNFRLEVADYLENAGKSQEPDATTVEVER